MVDGGPDVVDLNSFPCREAKLPRCGGVADGLDMWLR